MEKPYLISKQELLDLNLRQEDLEEVLKTKDLGYLIETERDYGGGFLGSRYHSDLESVVKIFRVDPRSSLAKIPLKKGDLLLGINDRQVVCLGGEPSLSDKRGGLTSLSGYIKKLEDGEKVDIIYGEQESQMEPHLLSHPGRMTISYETKKSTIVVNFLYDITEFPEIIELLENKKITELPKKIKRKLFNQDHAVDKVNKSLKIFFAGIKEDHKPIGGYLLLGPTGTGKTELAKLLSKKLDFNLIRLDMSEYGESHNVSRLLGSPPGYVGYNKATVLEEKIGNEGVKTVLLLDEFEKAHEDIQKAFLQVLDNSELTLGNGKKINFENTLILMTSNAGIAQKKSMGIATDIEDKRLSVDMEKIKRLFLPEFIGRLSGIIEFNALKESHAHQILDKFIEEFNERLFKKKKLKAEFSDNLKNYLVAEGFDEIYGARPLKNILSDKVYEKVADLLIVSQIKTNQILVDLKEEEIIVEFMESKSEEKREGYFHRIFSKKEQKEEVSN